MPHRRPDGAGNGGNTVGRRWRDGVNDDGNKAVTGWNDGGERLARQCYYCGSHVREWWRQCGMSSPCSHISAVVA